MTSVLHAPAAAPAAASTPAAPAAPVGGHLRVQGLAKSYGTLEVLRGVDLEVRPGEVTVILGPSGSGKSTLLRLVNHLERPDHGFVALDGEVIGHARRRAGWGRRRREVLRELTERDVLRQRTRIGFVFQNFPLFPHLTALENVVAAPAAAPARGRAAAAAEPRALLARVGLADKADARPRQLSGGQQQRVAIARALAVKPALLLFDEPTSALDPELVGEVLGVIRDLADDGTTLVVVTHEVAFARDVADTVVFMDDGVVVERGPAARVLGSPAHPRTRAFLDKVR
jgi:polar amino acid transport system ATP-binding protein